MDSRFKLIVDCFGQDRFKFDEPLRDHTELKVGGPAKIFFMVFTVSELVKVINMCRQLKLPYFLFGTGSKSMISDAGFEGLVIQNRTKNVHTISVKGKVSKFGIGVEEALIEVESGVSIRRFCETLDSQGFSSVEFSGISGSLGGSLLVSNFLQGNSLLQSRVKSIKVLDQNEEVEKIEPGQLKARGHIILSAILKVKAKD